MEGNGLAANISVKVVETTAFEPATSASRTQTCVCAYHSFADPFARVPFLA